jgi:hypothetical protein
MLELTHVNHDFLIPMALCVAGSVSTFKLLARPPAAQAPASSQRKNVPAQAVVTAPARSAARPETEVKAESVS